MIFDYFAELTERGSSVPNDISTFLARQLRKVVNHMLDIDGPAPNDTMLTQRQTPNEMFNPRKKPYPKYYGLWDSAINIDFTGDHAHRGGSDIKARFDKLAGMFLSSVSASTVEKQFYAHRDYSERLDRIQELLEERTGSLDSERRREIQERLTELTEL